MLKHLLLVCLTVVRFSLFWSNVLWFSLICVFVCCYTDWATWLCVGFTHKSASTHLLFHTCEQRWRETSFCRRFSCSELNRGREANAAYGWGVRQPAGWGFGGERGEGVRGTNGQDRPQKQPPHFGWLAAMQSCGDTAVNSRGCGQKVWPIFRNWTWLGEPACQRLSFCVAVFPVRNATYYNTLGVGGLRGRKIVVARGGVEG